MKNIARLIGFSLNVLAWIAPRLAGRKTFYLFCTPLAPPVRDYHRKYFDTAEKNSFEREGISIQTYRWGRGEKKILFVHGWQSHSFRWKSYIESYSPDEYSVFALDAPAHGLSGGKYINLPLYSRVIEHFIREQGPLHAIVSHSFGSFASLYALYCSPDLKVGKLVIMGAPGEATDFLSFYKGVLGLSAHAMRLMEDYFLKVIQHPPDFFSAARFAAEIQVPGLIIHDEGDDEAPYRYAIDIHDVWKNSTLMTTRGIGHNLKSPAVIEMIKNFMSGLEIISDSVSHKKY